MDKDKRKYKVLEYVLQKISGKYISLSKANRKRNNQILKKLLKLLTNKMAKQNPLFKVLFTRTFFGGSFYDGLKIGQPNEFDIDLLLSLPKLLKLYLEVSKVSGFVHLKTNLKDLYKQKDLALRYSGLEALFSGEFLDNEKVRSWMQSLVIKTLNSFRQVNGWYVLHNSQGKLYAKIHQAGPAFTLKVTRNIGRRNIGQRNIGKRNIVLDIDLVPCFEFSQYPWPSSPYRPNPYSNKPNFFIVPKSPKNTKLLGNLYWRMSFQEQERLILHNRQFLKPSIKFLKKMRDSLDLKCIASYYIKTVALWRIKNTPADDWKRSMGYVFMTLLKAFYNDIRNQEIAYYWNRKNNLLQGVSETTLSNVANRLKVIIDDINGHLDDNRFTVAKYILSPSEFRELQNVL